MEKLTRKFDGRTLWILLGVFVAVALFSFLIQFIQKSVDAANLSKFDAGYIISDYQMRNYNSMSESEIQSFLESKVSCNKGWSYYKYLTSNYSGYDWHYEDGHIVCLPEERFGNGQTIGSGDTAAHIIWQAAHDYKINPQVLIVLLQKEQGLITDSYPNDIQYRSATGYGCPDTAPCSSEYYGFKNQVRKAAALFDTVLSGGWTNYPLGYNYIQYNPNSDCGGSWVNVRNLATSALYRYTPYQPNAGALAAGYGSAYCGAYGNRNFYAYFEDWFGGITEEKIVTTVTEKNAKDKVTWELLKAMLIEADSSLDLDKYDEEFRMDEKIWRVEAVEVLWDIFGEKISGDEYFTDMKKYDALNRAAVIWAYNKGITKYYSKEGEFSPLSKMTRREAMIFLWRLAGQPKANVENAKKVFKDLPSDELGQKAIAWAYEKGITKYYSSEDVFAPSAITTRREAMIFLWRLAGQPKVNIENTKKVFKDFPKDELGQQAIAWAYEKGITKYYSGEGIFAPNAITTRREAMIFLWRYMGEPIDKEDIFYDMPDEYERKLAIVWAYRNGITKYYSKEGEFAPKTITTRKEAATFIKRAFN